MRHGNQVRKIVADVARVKEHAHRILFVDENGGPLYALRRGPAPKNHDGGDYLNVIAVVGPLWDEEDHCYREAVWLEIGLYRTKPYYFAKIKGVEFEFRRRYLTPLAEQVRRLWPYIEAQLSDHYSLVVARWDNGTEFTVPVGKSRLIRKAKRVRGALSYQPVEKGVRFYVSDGDAEILKILLESETALNKKRYQGLARFVDLSLSHLKLIDYSAARWRMFLRSGSYRINAAAEALARERSKHELPLALAVPKGFTRLGRAKAQALLDHLKIEVHDVLPYADIVGSVQSHLSAGVSLRLIKTRLGAEYSTFELLVHQQACSSA
jgi:hypothetical protein